MASWSRTLFPAATVLALLAPAAVHGATEQSQPQISIWVDGTKIDILAPTGTSSRRGKGVYEIENFSIKTADYEITLSALLDPDPSIAYAIGVIDFGAPSTFGFLFLTPIVSTASPNLVEASIVGGLTDFTGDGVSLTPIGAFTQVSSVGAPLTGMGVDVGLAASYPAGNPGANYTYGSFAAGPLAGPSPGPWTLLQTIANFQLSGNGDGAALTGFASIVENTTIIPEAGTNGGVLMLGALAGWSWRRQRTARK